MFPHDTLLAPLFWIGLGLIYALIYTSARIWAEDLGLKMTPLKWISLTAWYLFLSLGIGAGFTLLGEGETRAGYSFIGITIVLMIILGAGLFRYLIAGRVKPVKIETESAAE
jgi:hypothetical protein